MRNFPVLAFACCDACGAHVVRVRGRNDLYFEADPQHAPVRSTLDAQIVTHPPGGPASRDPF